LSKYISSNYFSKAEIKNLCDSYVPYVVIFKLVTFKFCTNSNIKTQTMKLQNEKLWRTEAYINGKWISAKKGKTFEVENPYNQKVIAKVADLGEKATQKAIEAAEKALSIWQGKTTVERSQILRKWYDLIMENLDDLALILTLEQGKPLEEAKGEIKYGASFVEWFAEEARRIYGDVIPAQQNGKRILTIKQAVGVVGAITPWNFPNAMITRKIAPALAAGCTVVIKPAANTPLSALALAELAAQAGFPKGVINIITSDDAATIGETLTKSPIVKKISFTGSTKVGKILLKQSAETVKKVSMELGGNAPFIVFEDADIEAAVEGAIAAKFRNAGQTCICVNRFYVQASVHDEFVEKLAKATKKLKIGNGTKKGVNIGPLINKSAVEKVERLLKDAIDKGAKIETGGKAGKGYFFEPTLISKATNEMNLQKEEIFGPIAAVFKFETETEVIKAANDTEFGLASYFYTKDYARIWRVSEGLEYGMVGINTGSISTAVAPFGGVKESGFGREGSKYGIDDFIVVKQLNMSV
jgi:succinate-semialdehyde dehydrogenase/glutarate-semialdehyde dehydrogenase